MYQIFEDMTFHEIVDFTIDKYIREYGSVKFNKLYETIMTANKLSGLLSKSKFQRATLDSSVVLSYICETPYFIFKSNWTQVVGAVLFLYRWDQEVNSELGLFSQEQLKLHAVSCYEQYRIFG